LQVAGLAAQKPSVISLHRLRTPRSGGSRGRLVRRRDRQTAGRSGPLCGWRPGRVRGPDQDYL